MAKLAATLFSFFISLPAAFPSAGKFIPVFLPSGKEITAELAITDEERQKGLMFRERLDSDQGMLFVFEEEGYYSFWMKNTLISLDILWLDQKKRIVHVEHNVPPCRKAPCPAYSPRLPALYVLELKAGSAEENGLKLYDRVDFILSRSQLPWSPSFRSACPGGSP